MVFQGKLSAFALGVAARFPGDTLEPVLISGGVKTCGWVNTHLMGFDETSWDFHGGLVGFNGI